MKRTLRKLFLIILTAIIFSNSISTAADGRKHIAQAVQSSAISDNTIMNNVSAESAILVETSTNTIIADKNAYDKRSISHLAKLMTVLIAAEKIESKELSLTDKVVTSANANSKGAPQIWLNVGETISVDELLQAVTIGNANDACTALAEKIAGSEDKFVKLMNQRASQMKMNDTHFEDCTGESEKTVSTAYDLSILSKELLKYNNLTQYFTTWMSNIRCNAVELVSTNRLIRNYKGTVGLKSCASKASGECLISAAKRGNMSVCIVLLNSANDDDKFSDAKRVMDYAFTTFEIYEPEIDEKSLENMRVIGGEVLDINVKDKNLHNIVIPRGTYKQISCSYEREESITAPVENEQKLGEIKFFSDEKEILNGEIVAAEPVDKVSFAFSLKRILLNVLYI